MADPISTLITAYHELNPCIIDELSQEPTPLEFLRYVAKNRPFIIRKAAAHWRAVQKWDVEYLTQCMRGKEVNVAITPRGNADAVVEQNDGSMIFVEPWERMEPFSEFLEYVREDTRLNRNPDEKAPGRNVEYAQTQNSNLNTEYSALLPDVPSSISFASEALNRNPDALNLWIGNHRSITSLHKDNYENLYVQIRGEKNFVLLPPIAIPCVNEQMLHRGRYRPSFSSSPSTGEEKMECAGSCNLAIDLAVDADDEDRIPAAVWDPDEPNERETKYSHLVEPLRVVLREGDILYLPAMWYHKVSQIPGIEGFACAVNYWYDMDFDGSFWAQNNFLRDLTNANKENAWSKGKADRK